MLRQRAAGERDWLMERLGRFESVQLLSPTALGSVWTARVAGSTNGAPYAVKLLTPSRASGILPRAIRGAF